MEEKKGMKGKVKKIFDDADKKAAELGEDEINARLGPATRMFFDIAESIEYKIAPIFAGIWAKVFIWFMAWLIGGLLGRFATPFMGNTPLVYYTIAGILLFAGLRTGLRSRGLGTESLFYFAWLLLLINGLRTSGGEAEFAPAFGAPLAGHALGWLTAVLFLPKPTSPDSVDEAIEQTLAGETDSQQPSKENDTTL